MVIFGRIKNCYYVPSMMKNIISIPVLHNDGYLFAKNKNSFYLMIDNNYHLLGTLVKGLYILQESNWIMPAQHKQKLDNHENAQFRHAKLGHISKDRMRKLVNSNLRIPSKRENDQEAFCWTKCTCQRSFGFDPYRRL